MKDFANKFNVDVQTKVHTGEKPFVSSTFGKGFTTQGGLKYHKASHSEERKHKWAICHEGRFFKTKAGLANHMKIHFEPEHKCKQCGKKFHLSGHLSSHMKTHFDPTYCCLQCGRKFHTSSNLKRHEKAHLG